MAETSILSLGRQYNHSSFLSPPAAPPLQPAATRQRKGPALATAENKRPRSSGGVERPLSRKEILGRKKAVKELIRKAVAVKDHLAQFPDFHKYERSGISVYLESGHGNQLSIPTRKYIQNLLKANVEGPYGSEWSSEEKIKHREMVAPEA